VLEVSVRAAIGLPPVALPALLPLALPALLPLALPALLPPAALVLPALLPPLPGAAGVRGCIAPGGSITPVGAGVISFILPGGNIIWLFAAIEPSMFVSINNEKMQMMASKTALSEVFSSIWGNL